MERTLGGSGIPVSALGLGCWAVGGPFWLGDGKADGWGEVDDEESVRAIRRALDLGVRFFDTADVYGAGHSEIVLGRALAGHRSEVVISTKFGHTFDPATKVADGTNASPAYVRAACEASLRRLGCDYIDLYHLHIWSLPRQQAEETAGALEDLRRAGLIGAYGWSTDDLDCARLFAAQPGCTAIQHNLNVFDDAPELILLCEQNDLASINRTPLAMGLLTGKFDASARLPRDDVRGSGHDWVPYFDDGRPRTELLERLAAVREILTSGGRTLAQGALAWIWARSDVTIPIPGFKTVAQVEQNAGAMDRGPLTLGQMHEIETLLGRAQSRKEVTRRSAHSRG
jgi:aryl-alcohol dehydrogenase-like predicted oxidoreductase